MHKNAYRTKMWTFLIHQNRFADNFYIFFMSGIRCSVSDCDKRLGKRLSIRLGELKVG